SYCYVRRVPLTPVPFSCDRPATPHFFPLSLHDALPIFPVSSLTAHRMSRPSSPSPWKEYGLVRGLNAPPRSMVAPRRRIQAPHQDRQSTRLNSSHVSNSYAVQCLKGEK